MSVTSFRKFANNLREEPLSYTVGITECKGVLNLAIGSLQLVVSQFLKMSSNEYYKQTLANRHVEIGTKAVKRGLQQILPSVILGANAFFLYQNWAQCKEMNCSLLDC